MTDDCDNIVTAAKDDITKIIHNKLGYCDILFRSIIFRSFIAEYVKTILVLSNIKVQLFIKFAIVQTIAMINYKDRSQNLYQKGQLEKKCHRYYI